MENIIEQIRNILRKEGITGMDSINHCILFIVCRLLTKELCKKCNIPTKYCFENIMKNDNGNEIDDLHLYKIFYTRKAKNCFVSEIVNKLKFRNIKFKIQGIHNLKLIMKKLQKLDVERLSTKYDLIGTIYEIHLKSGTSNAMRDLGQYYTHRVLIKYMIELCNIKMIDGLIEKIVDPTMGTGGFLTMAIKHLNSKYKNINWKKNKDNIIGFDIDDNVKNMALLNIFLEIGELCTDTLVKQDTLHNDLKFTSDGTILQKAKIILANEPMGLKNIIHGSCCDRIKNLKIRGTKAEPLFLQLFMECLDDDGRCAVIVPDGVLFNESKLHKKTRKHLIENFNLQKIISLNDKKFFLNTGVKTSILFFTKDGYKTKKVQFSEISLDNNENIKEKNIVETDYDTIKKHNYSLFVNKYNIKKFFIENFNIEYKKINDICDFLKKSKRKASFGKNTGTYPFYTSSTKVKQCEEVDYKDECIIIGTGGNANIKYGSNFSCSSDNFILKAKNTNENPNIKYLYYYLLCNIDLLENGFCGATIKHISKKYIQDLKIPIPPPQIQKKIIKQIDLLTKNTKSIKKAIEEFKNIMILYVNCNIGYNTDNEKIKNICTFLKKSKRKASFGKNTGTYPFYTSSTKVKKCEELDYKDECIIIGTGGNANIKYSSNFSCSSDNFILKAKNAKENPNIKYLYYYLLCNIDLLENGFCGATIKHISKKYIMELNIPIPSISKQQEIINYCDNLHNMIINMNNQIIKNKKLMKITLKHCLMS